MRDDDGGFSLIEIVIAMGLLSVVLLSSLPMLLSMLASTVTTKMNTQAKNLAQERLEQLRDLRFHVDRQNGPFLDLLDLYYTNANAAGTTTPVPASGGTLNGRYVSTGSAKGVAAPLYESATGPLTGATDFQQFVLAQFLAADGSVLPKAQFENNYDSQDPAGTGVDAPPSLTVRFTVVTEWTQSGSAKEYRTTTIITDGRPEVPLIQTQAKGVAITVDSTAADASTLQLQGGLATLDGAQSSGSSVSGYVTGAVATRTGEPSTAGKVIQFALPDQAVATTGAGGAQGSSTCGWFAFGPNRVANGTADISSGLPKSPSNVDDAGGPKVIAGSIDRGTGNGCGVLSFDNLAGDGAALSTASGPGLHMGAPPYVRVPDGSSTGDGVLGSGYVTSSALTTSPQQSKAGARVAMNEAAVIFPGNPNSGGKGLMSLRISNGSVDCVSGSGSASGTVTGSYTAVVEWWGKAPSDTTFRWHTATYTYDNTAATPLTVTGDVWTPATTDVGGGTMLSSLVTATLPSATNGVVSTGQVTGLRGFPNGILTVTTAPTRPVSSEVRPGDSAIKIQLGQLSCVADDKR